MNKTNTIVEETETTITINGNLELTEDYKTKKHLVVRGNISGKDGKKWNINARNINARNINARDIDAWNINAGDINAWNINAGGIDARNINARNIDAGGIDAGGIDARNIICEKRIKKSNDAKTISRVFIQNKSKFDRKEQMEAGHEFN